MPHTDQSDAVVPGSLVTNAAPAVSEKVRGFGMRMLNLVNRMSLSGLFGTAFGGLRDYYAVFGWARSITTRDIWETYYRGGVAKRVVHAFPDAVWGRPPQLYVKSNDTWNTQWDEFAKRIDLWPAFRRLDIMAGLGQYAIMVFGGAGGKMDSALTTKISPDKIAYLECYAEKDLRIIKYITDPTNPQFGMPEIYEVYPNSTKQQGGVFADAQITEIRQPFRVHYTRVLHVTKNSLENRVFGVPDYLPIWNYLTDLTKVVGSSSESYWMTAYQGMHANVDPDLEMAADDAADLSAEIDEYQHGMRRFIRTRGVEVKSLGSRVADPSAAFKVLLTLIAGTTGIPQRILIGSEAGQLASTQDKGNWAERVEEYRENHAQPQMIRPFVGWLNARTTFAVPDGWVTLWPEAYRQSPLERGQTSAQTARTLANIVKGLEPIVLTPGTPAVVDPATGAETTPATAPVTSDPLLSRDEARRLIGLSTDQAYIIEKPE